MWKIKVVTFARPLLVKLNLLIFMIQGYVFLLEMRACDLVYTFMPVTLASSHLMRRGFRSGGLPHYITCSTVPVTLGLCCSKLANQSKTRNSIQITKTFQCTQYQLLLRKFSTYHIY